jgi:hypothetical protein
LTNKDSPFRFYYIANHAHGIKEILSVIFLIAAAKNSYKLVVKVDIFKLWEEVIPVALRFTIVPGWYAKNQ